MPNNPLILYFIVGLACLLIGISKGGLGGTMGFLITPMVALVVPVDKAVGLILPMLMLGDIFAVYAYWRKWEVRHVWILLAGGTAGVTIGTFVITSVSTEMLRKGLGLMVLGFVSYKLLESRILKNLKYTSRTWHGLLAGTVAGFTSTLAHAGGPPVTIYLLMQRLPPVVFVATSAIFFAVLNWMKVPYYYFAGLFDFPLIISLAWLAPLVLAGVWLGRRLVNRIDRLLYERIITVLLLISAILLLR